MCGRYVVTKPVIKTVDLVKTNIKVEDSDNFNAHPSQKLPVIKSYTNGKALELCEWGLVPAWSKKLDKFSPLINARKETLMEKITFDFKNRTAVVTLTHDPKLDDSALNAVLKSNAFYIGSLGSKKTHNARIQRLKKSNFSDYEINRIHGPIGLDIGAKSPQEIAISIISEIISIRNKFEFSGDN